MLARMITVIPGTTLKIEVFGEIYASGYDESDLTRALRAHTGPVRVLINSPGGDAATGLALHALLSAREDVTTVNIAVCASAASLIFAAGTTRLVSPASVTMMHEAAAFGGGKADDLEEAARMLRAFDEAAAQVYARVMPGKDAAAIGVLMNDTAWLTAAETVEIGLATGLAEPIQAAARAAGLPKQRKSTKSANMSIRAQLGLPEDATDELVATAIDAALAKAKTAETAVANDAQIEAAVARALEVRHQSDAHAQACIAAVERFIADGKVAPASRENAIKACGASAQSLTAAVQYWESAPKMIGVLNLGSPAVQGKTLTPQQKQMCKAARITEEAYLEQLKSEGVN